VADNGKEALAALERRPDVDAVLMDLILPEMSGSQAIERLRQDSRFQNLPVIAMTARAMNGEASQAAGADAYLPKPVDPGRLLALLHARFHPGTFPE
jgi:CheY-like chemotaxis protein